MARCLTTIPGMAHHTKSLDKLSTLHILVVRISKFSRDFAEKVPIDKADGICMQVVGLYPGAIFNLSFFNPDCRLVLGCIDWNHD